MFDCCSVWLLIDDLCGLVLLYCSFAMFVIRFRLFYLVVFVCCFGLRLSCLLPRYGCGCYTCVFLYMIIGLLWIVCIYCFDVLELNSIADVKGNLDVATISL